MNDIFKMFKKRSQQGKSTNITDVIKDLNESEQNEIMNHDSSKGGGGGGGNRFDRSNKSYLSISKSGRLKSKKSTQAQSSRILNEELFAKPATTDSNNGGISRPSIKGTALIASKVFSSATDSKSNCNNSYYSHSRNNFNISSNHHYHPTSSSSSSSDSNSNSTSNSSSFRSSLEDIDAIVDEINFSAASSIHRSPSNSPLTQSQYQNHFPFYQLSDNNKQQQQQCNIQANCINSSNVSNKNRPQVYERNSNNNNNVNNNNMSFNMHLKEQTVVN